MSVRKDLEIQFSEDWADITALKDLRVIATERDLDDIQQSTALIRNKTLGKAPQLPNSHRKVGILLTLISGHIDADNAGDELDDLVDAALDYLDPRYLHEDATAVGYGDRLAYDIPLTILAKKEN